MSNNKMKGLLKGLRYISHIFENEKEPEMQIGYPTDVKHVAHIGWDGPSVNSPSWMNEFKAPPGFSSAPLSLGGEIRDDASLKWASEESSKSASARCSPARDLPEVPKTSRRHASTGSSAETTPIMEKSGKSKQSRKSSKSSSKGLISTSKSKDSTQHSESPTKRPDIPKKSRRKKSKDDAAEGSSRSSRSSRRANGSKSDSISECSSVSRADDLYPTSALNSSEGGEDKGSHTGIS